MLTRAGKNLGFLKKVFRILGFFKFYRFYRFFCTKTEHDSTTQKHMRKKNIPYMVRPSPSHGLQHTKLQASSKIDESHKSQLKFEYEIYLLNYTIKIKT